MSPWRARRDSFVQHLDEGDADQAQPAPLHLVDELQTAVESDLALLIDLRAAARSAIDDEDSKGARLVLVLERIAADGCRPASTTAPSTHGNSPATRSSPHGTR